MRKYIVLITALALMAFGLNAQTGRGSGLHGTGLDGFIEQTQFDSLHVDAGTFVYGAAGSGQEVTTTGAELNYLDITALGTGVASKAVVPDGSGNYTWPAGIMTYSALHDGITEIDATALEINYLDLTALGTGAASKAVVLDTGDDYIWPSGGFLTYGGTQVTTTGAELNYLDITALGTGVASKAVVPDGSGNYTWPAGIMTYSALHDGITQLTATALQINNFATTSSSGAELDYLVGATPGTAVVSIAAVLGANKELDEFHTAALYLGAAAGTLVGATAAELNYLDLTTGPGTSEISKAVVLDGSGTIDALDIDALSLVGVAVAATAAEIDVLAGVTGGARTVSKAIVVDGSGTIDALDIDALSLNGVAVAATAAEIDLVADKSASVIDGTTTLGVTIAAHSERYINLNAVAGFTSTLPPATGTGNKYTFIVVATITSGDYIIKVADGTDIMIGQAWIADDDAVPATSKNWLTDNTNSDTITMNGTSTGGIIGDKIILIDVATDTWSVQIYGRQTGTEATPFSATV